ncbi:YveK family protein [Paenibacillus sp. Soil787]|uniref:YveK family protein n=1 Tax=Paenibacillus sp. Soil787 TaxID=1736411 RepID=UPI0006F5A0F0|nr:Wzz/FepE/Etk N-terminal domain-containing protein [Paenibacillus sp. Soil787]KRF35881.1 hypothetical protein ASG93_25700 [Paenibacillus sp. Soil787]
MEIEFKQYFKIIQKRLWLIAIVVLLSSIATGIMSYYFISPIYAANTKIVVNKSSEYQGKEFLDYDSVRTNSLLVNTYKEIIKTPAILDKVVEKYPDLGLTVTNLAGMISVSSTNDTQVMTISITSGSYEEAAKTVNAVSEVFKNVIPSIMKVDNVVILNEAKPEDNLGPVAPNKKLNIIIAFIVSLMISIGIVLLLEYLDDSIKTDRDIEEYLGLPTLTIISRVRTEDLRDKAPSKPQRTVGDKVYASANQ